MGTKIITSESVVAITAKAISLVPSMAAKNGGLCNSSICRKMFSSTTMASSMTIPTASVRASRVMLLSEKSYHFMIVNVAMMEVGMAMEAISTARQLRMKRNTTMLANKLPSSRCSSRASTEARTKTD